MNEKDGARKALRLLQEFREEEERLRVRLKALEERMSDVGSLPEFTESERQEFQRNAAWAREMRARLMVRRPGPVAPISSGPPKQNP